MCRPSSSHLPSREQVAVGRARAVFILVGFGETRASTINVATTWRGIMASATAIGSAPPCRPTAQGEAAQSRGTWRVIFGSTEGWAPPNLENAGPLAGEGSTELCELCRQPISDGQGFITNSAGQRPTHLACLGDRSETAAEGRLPSRTWLGSLCELVGVLPGRSGPQRATNTRL